MPKIKTLPLSPESQLRQVGWDWMLGTDTLSYLTHDLVVVSEAEAQAYYDAANDLYELFIDAGQAVIDQDRFAELGIPDNLKELIRLSWDDDRHLHLYGRFDFAGGIDGKPIKLIEFNADTATCIPETGIVQWAHLKANGLDEASQFNTLYESLVENFQLLRNLNSDLTPTLLISTLQGFPEDETNVQVLGEAAKEAGFDVEYAYVEDVEFSPSEGIFRQNAQNGNFERFDFWFKLVPWEFIGWEEPDLADLLTQIVRNRKAVIINPAYTLLFQSKAILKVLWERNPGHPLLLPTYNTPPAGIPSVAKVMFGREGANVEILDKDGKPVTSAEGDYDDQPRVYQEYVAFPVDSAGNRYQAGVFFAGEGCGLGYRTGGEILDNGARFSGHIVE
ncbi:glutathionylspermidine synthase family protein [Siphonobacter aquaeclarae]|jgi:glutathionylspermidine synthase|uniref:Glutathionylspermidine synthase preATP-grasp n=1 Tax=Siphonobacter aquaeclarae TaxID=563176 RepID=A0A1G9SQS5_9BACT|nr:glutathionylspermidine synthase family protein [Siphonobacter aquaeclarae]SDM37772.1 Glutathionylspermidine synthase preATP-grasp [Siphonobacter aquaeclarae]